MDHSVLVYRKEVNGLIWNKAVGKLCILSGINLYLPLQMQRLCISVRTKVLPRTLQILLRLDVDCTWQRTCRKISKSGDLTNTSICS